MRHEPLIQIIFDSNWKCNSIDSIESGVIALSCEYKLGYFLIGTFNGEELFDQVVHVEKLVQLLFGVENGH